MTSQQTEQMIQEHKKQSCQVSRNFDFSGLTSRAFLPFNPIKQCSSTCWRKKAFIPFGMARLLGVNHLEVYVSFEAGDRHLGHFNNIPELFQT